MSKVRVGLIGARSLVGEFLIPILRKVNFETVAFTRHIGPAQTSSTSLRWQDLNAAEKMVESVPFFISLAPIWVLPTYFDRLIAYGVRRIVVLSSTSRFTKSHSTDTAEQAIAAQLIAGEEKLEAWALENGIDYVILRPTLIYGSGEDRNISEMARMIHRFGFFPVLGSAEGLRQPIHADDVAAACVMALQKEDIKNKAYNISGAEVMTYRQLIGRVFSVLGKRPRILTVPAWCFRGAVLILRWFPRYRKWTAAMADRMNRDLVFDHADASRDFGFLSRPFEPTLNPARREITESSAEQ